MVSSIVLTLSTLTTSPLCVPGMAVSWKCSPPLVLSDMPPRRNAESIGCKDGDGRRGGDEEACGPPNSRNLYVKTLFRFLGAWRQCFLCCILPWGVVSDILLTGHCLILADFWRVSMFGVAPCHVGTLDLLGRCHDEVGAAVLWGSA